jgi:hypothetical protein
MHSKNYALVRNNQTINRIIKYERFAGIEKCKNNQTRFRILYSCRAVRFWPRLGNSALPSLAFLTPVWPSGFDSRGDCHRNQIQELSKIQRSTRRRPLEFSDIDWD